MRWKPGSRDAATAERLMSRMRRVQEVECNARRSDHVPIILAEFMHARACFCTTDSPGTQKCT